MRCRSVLTRVDALRTGELSSDERGVVHAHLETCGSCNDSLTDVDELAQMVKVLSTAPPRSCCDAVKNAVCDSLDQIRKKGETVWVAFSGKGIRMIHRGSEEEARARYSSRHQRGLEKAE